MVALGGSLLRPDEDVNRQEWFEKLCIISKELAASGDKLGIVVGGGLPAREAIGIARESIDDERRLDEIGIAATRLNAAIIQQIIMQSGIDVAEEIPHDCDFAVELMNEHTIICMGGTIPGHTTDTVAVDLSCKAQASRCIIATNVSHVYNRDPRKYADAKKFHSLNLTELGDICGVGEPLAAGTSAVVDPIAVGLAIQSKMPLAILDGRNMSMVRAAILGDDFEGTVVTV